MPRMHPTRPSAPNNANAKPSWLTSQAPEKPGAALRRPAPIDGRTTLARFQALLYRHRWIRWAAAAGAAGIVLISLRGNEPNNTPPPVTIPAGAVGLLPEGTRGVPIPVTSKMFAVQNRVDVHAVADGGPVARSALVVETSDNEVILAIPNAQVDATVDALFTGGVMLVLVPSTNASSN